jgi:hypothetical protein
VQVVEQPFPLLLGPRSQASEFPASCFELPHSSVQGEPGVRHSYPDSIVQVAEQPSLEVSLPSSQASAPSIALLLKIFWQGEPGVGHS